jgi:hypothetical protein
MDPKTNNHVGQSHALLSAHPKDLSPFLLEYPNSDQLEEKIAICHGQCNVTRTTKECNI